MLTSLPITSSSITPLPLITPTNTTARTSLNPPHPYHCSFPPSNFDSLSSVGGFIPLQPSMTSSSQRNRTPKSSNQRPAPTPPTPSSPPPPPPPCLSPPPSSCLSPSGPYSNSSMAVQSPFEFDLDLANKDSKGTLSPLHSVDTHDCDSVNGSLEERNRFRKSTFQLPPVTSPRSLFSSPSALGSSSNAPSQSATQISVLNPLSSSPSPLSPTFSSLSLPSTPLVNSLTGIHLEEPSSSSINHGLQKKRKKNRKKKKPLHSPYNLGSESVGPLTTGQESLPMLSSPSFSSSPPPSSPPSSDLAPPIVLKSNSSHVPNSVISTQRVGVWYKNDREEKQRIRDYWLSLSEGERRKLVRLEKEAVLKKMKEQQKTNCNCPACGRKR